MQTLGKMLIGLGVILGFGIAIGIAIKIAEPVNAPPSQTPTEQTPVNNETMTYRVYFSQGENLDCSLVKAVERTAPESADIARMAIEGLLAGPTATETEAGYYTSINQGVELVDLTMSADSMAVTFSSSLNQGVAGACRVSAILAQIEQTLKQFATVKEVVIKIEGLPDEEILQP